MFGMMGVFAEFERAMIAERVRSGMARAKNEGKRRPETTYRPSITDLTLFERAVCSPMDPTW
jgi:DNA invertase Pin-like site-specific DNA recombinase